jgi:hypothetical protein
MRFELPTRGLLEGHISELCLQDKSIGTAQATISVLGAYYCARLVQQGRLNAMGNFVKIDKSSESFIKNKLK